MTFIVVLFDDVYDGLLGYGSNEEATAEAGTEDMAAIAAGEKSTTPLATSTPLVTSLMATTKKGHQV